MSHWTIKHAWSKYVAADMLQINIFRCPGWVVQLHSSHQQRRGRVREENIFHTLSVIELLGINSELIKHNKAL